MPKLTLSICVIFSLLLLSTCKSGVHSDDLYGKWKYSNVENPNASPPSSVPSDELKEQAPYIEFTKTNTLQIVWGGKVLSHGTFNADGTNIHYKEVLSGGTTREFPFFISQFNGKTMIFETLGQDGTIVTAVKE